MAAPQTLDRGGAIANARTAMRFGPVRAAIVMLAAAASAVASGGCTSLQYVTQAAVGQEDLELRARDIDALVRERRVDARMRGLLSEVAKIKRFGEAHGLTATSNYRQYVRVDAPAVVWVVSASAPLAFASKEWSFPLVGSFTYLGWFKKSDAQAFADDLRRQGWDVDLRGSGAYSTRGYFDDPVLSTMIAPGEEALGELANVILHESAHATFFVPDQSTLNESVAEFTGDHLAVEYLRDAQGEGSATWRAYVLAEERGRARKALMRAAYEELSALYASPRSDAEKRENKRVILERLRAATHLRREITNATLIQMRTYNSGQPELATLLSACGGDWGRFVSALARLERPGPWFDRAQESDVGKAVSRLSASAPGGCPAGGDELPPNVAGSGGVLDRPSAGR